MKFWSTEHTFTHPWNKVTEAAWRKYPNEQNTNVVAIDVIDRKCTADGVLSTTRIFGSHWNLPRVITSLFGMPEMCYAVEQSVVDMKNKKMTLKMVNYTFWGMLACEETLVYEPSKESRSETSLTQSAKISVNGIHFSNYFEGIIVNNFEGNSKKGQSALDQVLSKIKIENMLDAVNFEINELSSEIDKIDAEYHVTERLQKLGEELEEAASFINSELHQFSSKIKSDLNQLITTLDSQLNQISIEIDIKNASDTQANSCLADAVKQAGITVKTNAP